MPEQSMRQIRLVQKHVSTFILLMGLICSIASFKVNTADGADSTPRPNIIVFLADDMGLGDTSAYQDFTGNSDSEQIHTPSMERLARMGVRLTDAHTPSSRCSPTRYALLTGRYPWRNRLKFWVLFGSQGDPMIEVDRPTIATMLKKQGYHTGMVGKWHVGLRFRQADGSPAAGWDDASLNMPIFDGPLDHGFDQAWFTSRSHGTSGPDAGKKQPARRGKKQKTRSGPNQNVGPGHIEGRTITGATGKGKQLDSAGPHAYVLKKLGSRHSDRAVHFLKTHVNSETSRQSPFFLYYASNSNHAPYTADTKIGTTTVSGASRSKAGDPMNPRSDFVYENDVALGRLIDYLNETSDPRMPGHKLIDNTLVVFTSDNGAERPSKVSTGPFRSNKGSSYEGGHRVPFIAAWKQGRIGDGSSKTAGQTIHSLIGLQDLFATFAEASEAPLPDLRLGEKGAEDSVSVLGVLRGNPQPARPVFYHDHKEAKDAAASAIRLDVPKGTKELPPGAWKMFFDADLLRRGITKPTELYNLNSDPKETTNLISRKQSQEIVQHLSKLALDHRNVGGHRYAAIKTSPQIVLDWTTAEKTIHPDGRIVIGMKGNKATSTAVTLPNLAEEKDRKTMTVTLIAKHDGHSIDASRVFSEQGLGLSGGNSTQIDDGELLDFTFKEDVIVESVALTAGDGQCGGFYRVGESAPLAVYCVDADNDSKDQSGHLSDIGLVKAGRVLKLSSAPHYGVEAPGCWSLTRLAFRVVLR